MSKDYTELLKAVDLIVSQRLNNVAFDKTLVCKIINDENKSNGEYLVEYENMKMPAYALSETDEYAKGQEVYVTITQGDFNLKKIIIGSVKTSELPVYMYTNPLKNLVKLNAIPFTFGNIISPDINLRDYSSEGMPEIKYLAFGANFTTQLLNGQTLTSSDYIKTYGIRITGKGILKINNEIKEDIDWVFDNTMFQGNPYNFNGKFRQEQLFNIQNYSKLINLKITFFNSLESKIKVEVSNCELYYGYATEDLTLEEDYDKIIIYEVDDKKQYPNTSDNQIPSLKIQTKRITQKSGSVIITEDFSNTEQFEWYVYYTGAQDVGNGKNWALIKEQNSKTLDLSDNSNEFTLQINTEDEYAVKTKLPNNAIQKALQIVAKLKTSDTTKLTSNNLTFYRSDYDDLQEALKGSGIELSAIPQSFVYYGDSQKITTLNLSGNITANLTGAAVWKPGVDVYWRIPLKGTMFENPFTVIGDIYYWNLSFFGAEFLPQISNGVEEDYNSGKRYKCKETYISEDGNYAIVQVTTTDSSTPSLPFRIKSNYVAGSTNNVIKCTVEYKDVDVGDVYDSISIGFDLYGTQGTDYTVGIVFDGDPFLSVSSLGSTTICTLKAFLKDKDSNDITKQVGMSGTPFEKTAFEWNIEQDSIGETNIQFLEKTISEDNLTCKITLKSFKNEDLLTKYNGIISLTLKDVLQTNGLEVTYKVFCPIPLHYCTTDSPLDIYNNIALPTEVKYNYDGTNPLYNKDSVTINGFDIKEIELITNDINKNCIEFNETNMSILINSLAPSIFPKATLKVEVENSDVWYQPIAFYRNQYTSSLLNAWNGGLTIDDKGNKILTQILGAGIKNENNTFSGVLMGAVGTETNDAVTGLYGYQDGELRFKFNEDGDAYIGKGSDNHIDFTNGHLDIAAKKFTLHTKDNQDNTKIYISDTPIDGDEKNPIVQFGKALKLYKDGKLELGSDSDDDNFSLSVKYVGSQQISIQPDTLKGWTSSKDALITDQDKESGINTWEDKYLYLWTRTKVATNTYNYSSLISSKAKQKVQFSNSDTATTWYDDKNNINIDKSKTIFYRKIRYIEGVKDAWDVFEGPLELPQGKDGTSPYTISLNNDFDVIVRKPNGALMQETIEVGVQYFIGDDIQESFTELPSINIKDGDNGYEVKFKDETNYTVFTVTINDASITSGEVTVAWNNVSKIFKFKIIDGTEDYNLIVSPQVVNVDELGETGQNISVIAKNSKGEEIDYINNNEIIYIGYSTDEGNNWIPLTNNFILFTKNYKKIGIRLYYKDNNNNNPILFDEEWVQAVHNGLAGTSPYTISLDNDFETVVKNNRTNLTKQTIVVKPTAYYGSDIATDIQITATKNNEEDAYIISGPEDGNYTISGLNNLDLNTVYSVKFELKNNEDKILATKIFKFQIIEMERDYHLKIDTQIINISQNTTKTIQLRVVSGSTVYTKSYSENASDSSMAPKELEIYNTITEKIVEDWENCSLDLNNYDLNNNILPKFELRWISENSNYITIDIEEIALVVNGSDSITSLNSTSIIYFDSGTTPTKYEENFENQFTNLQDAVDYFKDEKVLKGIPGYVGKVTRSTYSNGTTNSTNYSYETYQSFVLNNSDGVIIDADNSSIIAPESIITRLLGTNIIMSENYIEDTEGMKIDLKSGTINSKYFKVTDKGEMIASAGEVGGWKIFNSRLEYDATVFENSQYKSGYRTGMQCVSGDNSAAFYAGCKTVSGDTIANESNSNFYVTNAGYVFCNNIKAVGGKIGSWNLDSHKLWKSTVWSDSLPEYGTGMSATSFNNDPAFYAGFAGNGGNPWDHASHTTRPEESKDWKKYTNFYVLNNGTLYASNAIIRGTLEAGSIIGDGDTGVSIKNGEGYMKICSDAQGKGKERSYVNIYSNAKLTLGVDGTIEGTPGAAEIAYITLNFGKIVLSSRGDRVSINMGDEGDLKGTWKLDGTEAIRSDINKKNTIATMSENYSTLFDNLHPVTYKYNDGTSDRLHTGFIAQEVKNALDIANINSKDFAGLVIFNQGTEDEEWTLRYGEFISLNTWQIQKLKIRVAELETELAEIKEKLK